MSVKLSPKRGSSILRGVVAASGDQRVRVQPGPLRRALSLSICLLIGPAVAVAASLQVAPVTLEFPPNAKASQVTLQNLGTTPINAQIRVFRWTQKDGEEQLTPSTDVVASPPAASLAAGQNYIVRVVRVATKPVDSEESYRLLVDELPQPTDDVNTKVNFIVRYSIPIFFIQTNSNPQLVWSADLTKDGLRLAVRNDGTRHIRISALKVEDLSGHSVSYGQGLVGYVLPHSTMRWTAPAKDIGAGNALKITAQGNNGPLSATAVPVSAGD
jgi:fimbrial chaperone protein